MAPYQIRLGIGMVLAWLALGLSGCGSNNNPAQPTASAPTKTTTQLTFAPYNSRAILTLPAVHKPKYPIVILEPGTGPFGPECMIPGADTVDGQPAPILSQFAQPFQDAGFVTLQIGKPGVDYATDPNTATYYNQTLFNGLHWADLVTNVAGAVTYAKSLSYVDTSRIYVLGHSEGTQVVVDYAHSDPTTPKGLILLGFAGDDLSTILSWQLFQRPIDDWYSPDVDLNHDGIISWAEAQPWPEIASTWPVAGEAITTIQANLVTAYTPTYNAFAALPLYSGGIWSRGPIYNLVTSLTQPVYVYNGSLDVKAPPVENTTMQSTFVTAGKTNSFAVLVPGVGHAFSPPRPPRGQMLLDNTMGPVTQTFQQTLYNLAISIYNN